ncbi:MAG: hypothetical protein DSZ32_07225 [Gammaproteobacteria bacterium]|nr:MAG: hypothetical protein DSZ32_07225 [Gammaproteobacteria bacterium]
MRIWLVLAALVSSANTFAMGLRSFVALPVEKGGAVIRLQVERAEDSDTDRLLTSAAIGISARQTLLFGLPYRLSPAGEDRQGDVSALYRHMIWQDDSLSGTRRLGLLGGVVIPTERDRDGAIQAGAVFTFFRKRHEIDADFLYQAGLDQRPDGGRYDLSWQYRLAPAVRPDWGVPAEVNSVVEVNGRWREGANTTHQITLGLQWIHQRWVLEGGFVQDLNNAEETRYLISTRWHF